MSRAMTREEKIVRNLRKARFYVTTALDLRLQDSVEYFKASGADEPLYNQLLNVRQTLQELIEEFDGMIQWARESGPGIAEQGMALGQSSSKK
jgi:hypothetical protein